MFLLCGGEFTTARVAARLSLVVCGSVEDFGGLEELAILMLLQRSQELVTLVDGAIESEGALLEVLRLHSLQSFQPIQLLSQLLALLAQL